MKRWAVALVAGMSMFGAPALAGEAKCMWDHAPQAARDHLMSLADTDSQLTNDDLSALMVNVSAKNGGDACGVTDATEKPAGLALVGYAMTMMSERWLAAHRKVTDNQLEAGWVGMERTSRDAFVRGFAEEKPRLPTDAEFDDFVTHMKSPGLTPTSARADKTGWAIGVYLQGRGVQGAFEPEF